MVGYVNFFINYWYVPVIITILLLILSHTTFEMYFVDWIIPAVAFGYFVIWGLAFSMIPIILGIIIITICLAAWIRIMFGLTGWGLPWYVVLVVFLIFYFIPVVMFLKK